LVRTCLCVQPAASIILGTYLSMWFIYTFHLLSTQIVYLLGNVYVHYVSN